MTLELASEARKNGETNLALRYLSTLRDMPLSNEIRVHFLKYSFF